MLKILVIEDDADFAAWMADELHQEFQADILIAYTYTQARAALTSTAYDIIVLDLLLDDRSGLELSEALKEHQPSARLVLATKIHMGQLLRRQGTISQRLADQVKSLEADAYLVKPFSSQQLFDAVRGLLGGISTRDGRGAPLPD